MDNKVILITREDVFIIITIIASILTICSAIISGIFSYFCTKNNIASNEKLKKETINSNEKLQKKLSEDRIKADIISSARIKWIEEVRESTTNYINAIVKYTGDYSDKDKKSEFARCSYRMMLYFPGISGEVELNNDNKLLDELLKKYSMFKEENSENEIYSKLRSNDDLNSSEEEFISNINDYLLNSSSYSDENSDDVRDITNMFINKMFAIDHSKILSERTSNEEINDILTNTLCVISENLKLEWKRAGKNK